MFKLRARWDSMVLTVRLWRRVFSGGVYLNFGAALINLALTVGTWYGSSTVINVIAMLASTAVGIWVARKDLKRDREQVVESLYRDYST